MNLKETKKRIDVLKDDVKYFSELERCSRKLRQQEFEIYSKHIMENIVLQCEAEKKIKDIRFNFYLNHGYFPDE